MLVVALVCLFPGCKEGSQAVMWTVTWSPVTPYVAAGGYNNQVLIFDTETFRLQKVMPIGRGVLRMAWHPTEPLLAVAAEGPASRIINLKDYTFKQLPGINEGTRAIAWNRNGTVLASANYDENITFYSKQGDLIMEIDSASSKSFVAIDWHPYKDEIITTSDSVRIFNMQGEMLFRYAHRREDALMLCVQWHPSGAFYAVGDYGDFDFGYTPLLQYFDPEGLRIFSSSVSVAEYRNMSWSADGTLLATASDALRIWTKDGDLKFEQRSQAPLWGVDWSPDGHHIVTSDEHGKIKLWNDRAVFIQDLVY